MFMMTKTKTIKHLTILLAFIMTLSSPVAAQVSDNPAVLTGKVTHVRDGDTIEVNGIAVRSVDTKVTTPFRSYWRGNSDIALDGAGVKPSV